MFLQRNIHTVTYRQYKNKENSEDKTYSQDENNKTTKWLDGETRRRTQRGTTEHSQWIVCVSKSKGMMQRGLKDCAETGLTLQILWWSTLLYFSLWKNKYHFLAPNTALTLNSEGKFANRSSSYTTYLYGHLETSTVVLVATETGVVLHLKSSHDVFWPEPSGFVT